MIYCNVLYFVVHINTHTGQIANHPAGKSIYPFEFEIPDGLPASLICVGDGIFAEILYFMDCTISRPGKQLLRATKPFLVNVKHDISGIPLALVCRVLTLITKYKIR